MKDLGKLYLHCLPEFAFKIFVLFLSVVFNLFMLHVPAVYTRIVRVLQDLVNIYEAQQDPGTRVTTCVESINTIGEPQP